MNTLKSLPFPSIQQQDLATLKASQRYGAFPYCFDRHLNSDKPFLWNSFVVSALKLNVHIHQSSPGNLSMNNQPGTPRDDGEMGGNFLNPFQSESVCMLFYRIICVKYSNFCHSNYIPVLQYSPNMTMSVWKDSTGVTFSPCSAKKQDLLKTGSLVFCSFCLWWTIVNYSNVILN